MGNIKFDIAALCIVVLNVFLLFSRKRLHTEQCCYFAALLFASLIATSFDIATVLVNGNASAYPRWHLYALNTVFYAAENTIPVLYTLYLLSLSSMLFKLKRLATVLLYLPWIFGLLLIFTNFRTDILFAFDHAGLYIRGPALPILYGIVLVYTIVSIASLFLSRKSASRETLFALWLFIPFTLVPVLIQFYVPEQLVQNLGISLSELFILLTVQDFKRVIDPASGFLNRGGFESMFALKLRWNSVFSVFLISLEGEGSIDAERRFLDSLARNAGKRSSVAQTGAGKFALVVEGTERASAIRRELEAHVIDFFRGTGNRRGLSVRACEIAVPSDTVDFGQVCQAQYRLSALPAYKEGRILSLRDLNLADMARTQRVERAIRSALETDGFELYFQPIVSARTEFVESAEALLRLNDPELGWIPPDEFIPIAESSGSIHRIGNFVIERSCRFLRALRDSGRSLAYIEINLSAAQCLQYNLTDRLIGALRRYGLVASDLCLEITETAAVNSPNTLSRTMSLISGAGFPVAIDDFGTGYSNIVNLMGIHFSVVKLDRSLIEGMERTEKGRIGTLNLIRMFSLMGITLVAEGVERKEQLDAVREAGVDLIQGYYFSKPLPEDAFYAFLDARRVHADI